MRRLMAALVLGLVLFCASGLQAQESPAKWPGIDEIVVEKFASDLGREARDPYINTDQGDLLLFLFALAGSVGGFVMGYFWHKVFVAGRRPEDRRD